MTKVTASKKAELLFPVGRTRRGLREALKGRRLSDKVAVYMAALLEFFAKEVLDQAVDAAHKHKKPKTRVNTVEIVRAMKGDPSLAKLVGPVVIPKAGVLNQV